MSSPLTRHEQPTSEFDEPDERGGAMAASTRFPDCWCRRKGRRTGNHRRACQCDTEPPEGHGGGVVREVLTAAKLWRSPAQRSRPATASIRRKVSGESSIVAAAAFSTSRSARRDPGMA